MNKFILVFLVFQSFVFVSASSFAKTTMKFDEKSGLFQINHQTLNVVSANFVFWHADWKWSDVTVRGQVEGKSSYKLSGESEATGLFLNGSVTSSAPNEMSWQFKLNGSKDWNSNQWGGISFKIKVAAMKANGFVPAARLLPNNGGWQLELQPGQPRITIRFDPPVSELYFERGSKNEILAYFVSKGDSKKEKSIKMTVSLPKDGQVIPTTAERLAKPSSTKWYKNILSFKHSPVDLSFLNSGEKPAGKHGFLQAKGEDLVFEDGTKMRFWGTNITAYTLFKTKESSMHAQARRLSKLGFNLVRFTHHDSNWVQPNIFGNRADNTLILDSKSLNKLDLWIKILRDEGIYIWLDLHVGREFLATDGVRDFAEIAKGKSAKTVKGFSYINLDIQSRMMDFSNAYLSHVNPYTSLAYKDDPAIVSVLITNENDLTHHFGSSLLANKNVPVHNQIYLSLAREFAKQNQLVYDKTWRSWEYGPSKIFLNELEHRFNQNMIKHLREVGLKVPIATTNSWGGMPLSSLPSLTDGDVIDVHSYGGSDIYSFNPRYRPNFSHWIAAASVAGKPLTVTEWNVSPFPSFDRFAAPIYLASVAGLQDWGAMMQYAYAQVPLGARGRPSNWHAFNDPGMLALMPAAALLFRQDHVAQANNTYYLSVSAKDLMTRRISPSTSRTIRTLTEQSKLRVFLPPVKELPWLNGSPIPPNVINVKNFNEDFIPKQQEFVCSDTKELCRNWRQGIATIDTPKSQIASGWLGGHAIELGDISVKIKTASAGIAVQSLDNLPIATSTKILISMSAQSIPEVVNRLPMLSEPVEGTVHIKTRSGLNLYALDARGNKRPVDLIRTEDGYTISLDKELGTYWLLLE